MEASKKTQTLWAITDELSEVGALIAEAGGELSPELEARLDAAEGAFEDKVERVVLYIRHVQLLADNAKAERDRLAKIQKYWESQAEGLKNRYLLGALARAGVKRVETERARVRVQKSGPSIEYHGDLSALPESFVRVVPETKVLDRSALLEVARAGLTLPDGVTAIYGQSVVIY